MHYMNVLILFLILHLNLYIMLILCRIGNMSRMVYSMSVIPVHIDIIGMSAKWRQIGMQLKRNFCYIHPSLKV